MNYNFATDTEKLDSLKTELKTEIGNISTEIGNIYKTFDSLPGERIWSGEAYNSFKTKADSYKSDLENIVNILNSYVSVLDEVDTKFGLLYGDVSSICTLDEE